MLIALGIAGFALPLLQGVLFTALGLILISSEVRLVRKWRVLAERRWPRLRRMMRRSHQWGQRQKQRWRRRHYGRSAPPTADDRDGV